MSRTSEGWSSEGEENALASVRISAMEMTEFSMIPIASGKTPQLTPESHSKAIEHEFTLHSPC